MSPIQHLVTGGHDPFLPKLLDAINRATHIDITVAFIRLTGLMLIFDALRDALQRKTNVRILTGDYLNITDYQALRQLMLLQENGAEIRIFETRGPQSFHMKAYLFARFEGGMQQNGCAYIGSSNISQSALNHGLEWNLKVEWTENPSRFDEIRQKYETLFNDENTKPLTHQWIDRYQKLTVIHPPGADEPPEPPCPNNIQQEALQALEKTRTEGYQRGLVVLATGLGKTWLAAFDTEQVKAKRILFVAHREEILDQAEMTFVHIRPESRVGRYTGKKRELEVDMLFASIQTLGRLQHLERFPADSFDYIIVDEFHHASARTYRQLLIHFTPRFLLGLTATPERTDQTDILALCDDNLVFRRDLFDGIEAKLLSPFHYYGIGDDQVDYQAIPWRNGKFDPDHLLNQLATHARAKHALEQWRAHRQSRTLAFCISMKHADFMAEYFNRNGHRSVAVHSQSEMRRNEALSQLEKGVIEALFSVDLFNEGVDIPAIDTVLMLRPSESKIIFLQQLGRGLRTHQGKEQLVVLDFIGNHISFFRKPEALFNIDATNSARRDFIKQARRGTLELPEGCFVNYDLKSIDFMAQLVKNRVGDQADLYRSLKESKGRRPTLAEFHQAGGKVQTIRGEYDQWLGLVEAKGDLAPGEDDCFRVFKDFFREVETTQLTRSFKMVLLEALLEMDGFTKPPTTESLAKQSYIVIQRRRVLLKDLPERYKGISDLNDKQAMQWHHYWRRNPVNAWVGGNRRGGEHFFNIRGGNFLFNGTVPNGLRDSFSLLLQELVDYRFLRYEARPQRQGRKERPSSAEVTDLSSKRRIEIPYFSDLKIACGFFMTSYHEDDDVEHKSLPEEYGRLDPASCFIARARGDSMDGGKSPIKDGDYLLLEAITPDKAGSISDQIVAIERQDTTGDNQYLLRYVKKLGPGSYQLIAQNLDYSPMMASEEMRTFARFKRVIDRSDL
ncbi:MAG: DEAD/DEAH box helicase family protein [Pseudomonadota bacterium]